MWMILVLVALTLGIVMTVQHIRKDRPSSSHGKHSTPNDDPPPIRYDRILDRPRNVGLWDYRHYLNRMMLGILILVVAFTIIFMMFGIFINSDYRRLQTVPIISIADAVNSESSDGNALALTGFLVSDDLITMPGDSVEKMLAGELILTAYAKHSVRSREARKEQKVFDWRSISDAIYLSDGHYEVRLFAPQRALPLIEKRPQFPRIKEEVVDNRWRPVAVDFDGLRFELDSETFTEYSADRVHVTMQRKVLEPETRVTVVAALDQIDGAIALVAPSREPLRVTRGTVRDAGNYLVLVGIFFPLISGLLWLLGVRVVRQSLVMREDFRRRSNE